ncbi:MAG: hypothetical protein U0174_25385 [Polyangiaceae bacterium]
MHFSRATRSFALGILVCASGCVLGQGGKGSSGSSGSAASDASDNDGGTATGDAGVQGLACGADRATGVTLCSAVSSCPNLVVDGDALPSCGFRVKGTSYDIQCVCGDWLCPVGTPTTCTEAAQLMNGATSLQVCLQVNENRCVPAIPVK